MRKLALLVLGAVLAVACISPSDKLGTTRPSGPGQNTMSASNSVAIASDQNAVQGPAKTTNVTKSDSTDTSGYCQNGFWVGAQDGGAANNVAVFGTADTVTSGMFDGGNLVDAASARVIAKVPQGSFVAGSFQRILSTGTTADNIICLGH